MRSTRPSLPRHAGLPHVVGTATEPLSHVPSESGPGRSSIAAKTESGIRPTWHVSAIGRTPILPGHQHQPRVSSHSPAQCDCTHSPSRVPPLHVRMLRSAHEVPFQPATQLHRPVSWSHTPWPWQLASQARAGSGRAGSDGGCDEYQRSQSAGCFVCWHQSTGGAGGAGGGGGEGTGGGFATAAA